METTNGVRQTLDQIARTPLSVVLVFLMVLTAVHFLAHRAQKNQLARVMGETCDILSFAIGLVFFLVRPFLIQIYSVPSGSMVPTLQVGDTVIANKFVYRVSNPKFGDIVVFRPEKHQVTANFLDENGEVSIDYMKRCVGVPGDLIEIKNRIMYRNGKPVHPDFQHALAEVVPGVDREYRPMRRDEVQIEANYDFKLVQHAGDLWPVLVYEESVNSSDLTAQVYRAEDESLKDSLRNSRPARLPPGCYLMVGDNTYHSYDSRSWGVVKRSQIIGRADVIALPLGRLHLFGTRQQS